MAGVCKRILVRGVVQGVGFRPFIYRIAKKYGLHGYVRNTGGRVEIVVEGNMSNIDRFLYDLNFKNPPRSKIDTVEVNGSINSNYRDFSILDSRSETTPDSIMIQDVGICPKCLNELFDPHDRRYQYPFISCTECGPRYTFSHSLPYDRQNTSMGGFIPCAYCTQEYIFCSDRRFHGQTICCSNCGPNITFADKNGNSSSFGNSAIVDCAKAIDSGKIIAVKGYGGFHIICDASKDNVVELLRRKLQRPQQPFAVMAKDIGHARSFAFVNSEEEELLCNISNPIVVLDKRENIRSLSSISPQLSNVGVMLPYSGIHHLLFHNTLTSVYVMTSANLSGLPMVLDNDIAIKDMAKIADNYLLHDLKIENRVDDSVIRSTSMGPLFVRRSRGYVPQSLDLPFMIDPSVGVGAQLNTTMTFAAENKAYISQHIGNMDHFEVVTYYEKLFNRFGELTSITPKYWGCDLHPQLSTTKFALEHGVDNVVPVQHHHAHVVSLMADAQLEKDSKIIGIALDGAGYGDDGSVWGGEILDATYTDYNRQAHLKPQPMAGGDIVSYYPGRMVLGMLKDIVGRDELLKLDLGLKNGPKEASVVLDQLDKDLNTVMSTSAGRVLDAASALLGICSYRSYQGEPAMKLESVARGGINYNVELPLVLKGGVFDSGMLLHELYDRIGDYSVPELAYAFEDAFALGVAELALRSAKKCDVDIIGLTGGVAYNEHIAKKIADEVNASGLRFISHRRLPCGDGGISLGQAIVAGLSRWE